mgnify:CR=1 FL=1|jgi:hypothetical protein
MERVNKYISETGQEFNSLEECLFCEIKNIISETSDAKEFTTKLKPIIEKWLNLKGEKIVKSEYTQPKSSPLKPYIEPNPDIYPYDKYPKIWYKNSMEEAIASGSSSNTLSDDSNKIKSVSYEVKSSLNLGPDKNVEVFEDLDKDSKGISVNK